MLLPCEVGVKTVLPAIRALIARDIVEKHGFKESQAAELLNLSQSAISRYTTRNRGNLISIENVPEVQILVEQMINSLLGKSNQTIETLELFCQICKTIREKGLMCELCLEKMHNPSLDVCEFCRKTEF